MNTISRYLAREISGLFAAALVFTLFLLSLVNIFQAVELLVGNVLGPGPVMRYWGYLLAYQLPYALGLAMLIAVMITFSRFTRDNELIASRSLGIPLRALVRPLLLIGLAVSLTNLLATGFLQPAGRYQARLFRSEARLSPPAGLLRPGSLVTFFRDTTIFIPTAASRRPATIIQRQGERVYLINAERVRLLSRAGQFFLLLENGFLQAYDPAEPGAYRKLDFETMQHALPGRAPDPARGPPERRRREQPLTALAGSRAHADRVELHARLAIALAPLVLFLAGVPLGTSLGGSGRGIIGACLVVLAYHLLLEAFKFVAADHWPPATHLMQLPNIALAAAGARRLRE